MENPIQITWLNDFIFCPASIYFHMLDEDTDKMSYQESSQLNGSAAHEKSDNGAYSTSKNMLQGIFVYSEKYNLLGKIDTFDTVKGVLTERKKKIKNVFDGYIYQLYAQYFALSEMGYPVKEIRLYSMDDNKVYPISLPENDSVMMEKFENTISRINSFDVCKHFRQDNELKCRRCIYEPLCCFSALKGE